MLPCCSLIALLAVVVVVGFTLFVAFALVSGGIRFEEFQCECLDSYINVQEKIEGSE